MSLLQRLCCMCLFSLAALPWATADVFEGAAWLRDPRMAGTEVVNYLGRAHEAQPESPGPWNLHTLFRKEIVLRAEPQSARLLITGDDYYKFSVNGYPVVQGPAPGYPFAHPYFSLEIASFLQQGLNVLGSHSYYQGLVNSVWNSGSNRSGFIMVLEVRYPDGGTERFVTDDSWRCLPLDAFTGSTTTGNDTQFLEHIDMRRMPRGWRWAGFDDSAWHPPLTGRQDHRFVPQATPPLELRTVRPETARNAGEGRYFYDFGRQIVGHTRIRVQGQAGQVVRVRHGEELDGPDMVRYALRAGCVYEEEVTLSGHQDLVEFFDYRGFRYIEILDAPAEPEVWVDVRHHPLELPASSFYAAREQIADIWRLCRDTVQMTSQGSFINNPTRDKAQTLGSAVIASRAHLWLTGDGSLTRKVLTDFYYSSTIHPGLLAIAPGNVMREVPEEALQYPLMLRSYYQHTGDRATTEFMLDRVVRGLIGYYAQYENEAGLLENVPGTLSLADAPVHLLGNPGGSRETVLNAFYYGGLVAAAETVEALGRDGAEFRARAERVAQGFAARLVDPQTGLYVDAQGSTKATLLANAVPLAFGLHQGADKARMIALVQEQGLNCSVPMAAYVLEGLFRNGAADLAFSLMTGDHPNSWNTMLARGMTSTSETWRIELQDDISLTQAWGSSPVYLLAEYVFGLQPGSPGWDSVAVSPRPIKDLPPMTLTAPHRQGRIVAGYIPGEGYRVNVPTGVPAHVRDAEGLQVTTYSGPREDEHLLTQEDIAYLRSRGWDERVGMGRGVWIDVDTQRMYILENMRIIWQAPCATGEAGTGSTVNSLRTPLGWHEVSEKIGAGAPWGQIFRARVPTGRQWKPGDDVYEDMVLTRILWLDGLEPGKNRGRNADGVLVDSKQRFIYIHGTNGEPFIGTPSSHGCIRLRNDDVLVAFEKLPVGTPVLITERSAGS